MSKKMSRFATLVIAGGTLLGAVALPAWAATSYPSGGIWNHGTGGGWVWSDYFHPSRCHGSSVRGAWWDEDSASAGRWSEARAKDRWYAVDHAYYKSYC